VRSGLLSGRERSRDRVSELQLGHHCTRNRLFLATQVKGAETRQCQWLAMHRGRLAALPLNSKHLDSLSSVLIATIISARRATCFPKWPLAQYCRRCAAPGRRPCFRLGLPPRPMGQVFSCAARLHRIGTGQEYPVSGSGASDARNVNFSLAFKAIGFDETAENIKESVL
jgi:hypothetical protein